MVPKDKSMCCYLTAFLVSLPMSFLLNLVSFFRSSAVPKKVDILEGMHVIRWIIKNNLMHL